MKRRHAGSARVPDRPSLGTAEVEEAREKADMCLSSKRSHLDKLCRESVSEPPGEKGKATKKPHAQKDPNVGFGAPRGAPRLPPEPSSNEPSCGALSPW